MTGINRLPHTLRSSQAAIVMHVLFHRQHIPIPNAPPTTPAGQLAAYTQLLVVPLMARMSDPLPPVRRAASPTFAALVALLPLAQVRPNASSNLAGVLLELRA